MHVVLAFVFILPLVVGCSQRATPEDEHQTEVARPRLPVSQAPPALTGVAPGPVEPGRAGDPALAVHGTIELGSGAVSTGGVVFVLARPVGGGTGPPLAVVRHPAERFPLDFSIGPSDAMIAGTAFPDSVEIEVRLDADGIATTRAAEDRLARSPPVAAGARGVVLTLETRDEDSGP